jgi:hypothetical protein
MGPRLGEGDCDRALMFRTRDSSMLSSSSSFAARFGGGLEVGVGIGIVFRGGVGGDGEGDRDLKLNVTLF